MGGLANEDLAEEAGNEQQRQLLHELFVRRRRRISHHFPSALRTRVHC